MSVATQPFSGTFVADPTHSSLTFAVKHMQVSIFRASFDDVDARIVADRQGIRFAGAARIESLCVKDPDFRAHVVHSADFFDARRHPELTFRSDDVQLDDDGTFTARVELTIKGVTKPVAATGAYQPLVEDPYGSIRTAVELTATVDRRDWGMDWLALLPKGGDALSYDVQLTGHLELIQES